MISFVDRKKKGYICESDRNIKNLNEINKYIMIVNKYYHLLIYLTCLCIV